MKFPLTESAKKLLEKRYIHKELGEESWEDVVYRVVRHVMGKPDFKHWDEVYDMILERYFVPNSPTLVNAGTKIGGLSACFVVPFEDSLEEIAKTKYQFMKIAQKGGGCGTTLSKIRPEGMPVAGSTHSKAGGPIKFFNTICEDMKAMTQAGFRRMAMMGTMSADHPDIEKFIIAKTEEGLMDVTNISVMATDDFMIRAIDGINYHLIWNNMIYGKDSMNAGEILNLIAKQAWLNGEPGLLFEDTINENTPYKYSGQYILATNPCGEQPLPSYGVCNLGSIDVSKYWNEKGLYDFDLLGKHVELAIIFLNAVVDVAEWPTPEIADWVKRNRPVGLGIMGLADLFLQLEIPYGGPESLEWTGSILNVFQTMATKTSEELANLQGVPEACKELPSPRRNITVLSIAPTGSIAMIAGCSHGIEPIYSPAYIRYDEDGDSYEERHPLADKDYFRSAINGDPDRIVNWMQHVDVQATCQNYVDSGVSKTINFPNDATVDDIKAAMIYAWQSGCKGITVYRDGSRNYQILNDEISLDFENGRVTMGPGDRPMVLDSRTYKLKGGDSNGNVYVTVSFNDRKPWEVFYNSLSIDLKDVQMRDGFSRLSSLALRWGVPVDELVKELRQIPAQSLKSVPARIALVLEDVDSEFSARLCPECGELLSIAEGCSICESCGYSECG